MTRLRFWIVAAVIGWFAHDGARAQTVQVAPDCLYYATYTVVSSVITRVNGATSSNPRSPSAGFDAQTSGCVSWTVTYSNSDPTALTALSLRFDSAPDSDGSPGTWTTFVGTVVAGSNPQTNVNQAYATFLGYNRWVSSNLTSVTGTGTISVYAYGCRTLTCASIVSAASIGAAVTIVGPLGQTTMSGSIPVTIASDQSPVNQFLGCSSQAEVSLSGTGYTQIVAGSGSKVIQICKLFVVSQSANAPVVNTFSVAFGTCAGSPTEAMNAGGVTGLDSDFGGTLRSGAGGALCVSESVANSDKVTVTYLQR
jgi:hypothetical protein